ncbi:RNA-directed DNA polymerase, eukaryota, reverse transcriptase zinc-binding domain protein [Tanacetum coccineum]
MLPPMTHRLESAPCLDLSDDEKRKAGSYQRKKQSLIFKFDFEKAYDSVLWDFLDDILVKFGFGIKWRGWIQNCLNSSKGSILVNGSPMEEFQFYKGLKQELKSAALNLGGLVLNTPSSYLGSEEYRIKLARKISSWWNVDYVDVSSYEEWYTWLVSLRLQANLKAVFEGIFYCLWWSVWMFFTPEGRIAWVDVERIPFKFLSGKMFKKIATKWGELLDADDHDEMSFHSKRI